MPPPWGTAAAAVASNGSGGPPPGYHCTTRSGLQGSGCRHCPGRPPHDLAFLGPVTAFDTGSSSLPGTCSRTPQPSGSTGTDPPIPTVRGTSARHCGTAGGFPQCRPAGIGAPPQCAALLMHVGQPDGERSCVSANRHFLGLTTERLSTEPGPLLPETGTGARIMRQKKGPRERPFFWPGEYRTLSSHRH